MFLNNLLSLFPHPDQLVERLTPKGRGEAERRCNANCVNG